jgi:arylsulfatase A-like enzyme
MARVLAFALLVSCAPPPRQEAPARPNVLFIGVDDLRPELGCYGVAAVRSPNLDALASRAVRFDRAYCQYPLCNPSRTSLLTGRYPSTTQVVDNTKWFRDAMPEVVTLPQHFRASGYATLRTGKIFHGGLDDDKGWKEGGEPLQRPAPRTPQQNEQRRRQSDRWEAAEDEEKLLDHRTATRAIELLEKSKGVAFFLAVGFAKPHSPYVAPKRHFGPYDPAGIALPADFAPRPTVAPGVPAEALSPNGDVFIGRDATEAEARQIIAAYRACVSFVDAQIGRVLEALDRLGLREKTVIVFFGDHGYHLGEKGKWSKHNSLYEIGTRVPLLVALPGAKGAACRRTVELVDLYPTLVELCGLPPVAGIEGDSLVPLLRDPAAAWDRPARSMTVRGKATGWTVRTERWRYTEWPGGAELYDHEADAGETRNLAADPALAGTIAGLKRLLR